MWWYSKEWRYRCNIFTQTALGEVFRKRNLYFAFVALENDLNKVQQRLYLVDNEKVWSR